VAEEDIEIDDSQRPLAMKVTEPATDEAMEEMEEAVGELEEIDKAFCPTGQGGGIDPTCSPGGGGAGGTSGGVPYPMERLAHVDDIRAARSDIHEWKSAPAIDMAEQALFEAKNPDVKVEVWRDQADRVKGIVSTENALHEGEKVRIVNFLASDYKGAGTQMMHKVFTDAVHDNVGVQLDAVWSSQKFYDKLGMQRVSRGNLSS
jgi:hypothetical protein